MPPTAEPTLASPEVPRPVRSRMIWWLVVLPAALLLLLALGTANWRVFHLIYCQKALLASRDERKQQRGLTLIEKYHVKPGMRLEVVRRMIRPLELVEHQVPDYPPREGRLETGIRNYDVFCRATGGYPGPMLDFDGNGCLVEFAWLK